MGTHAELQVNRSASGWPATTEALVLRPLLTAIALLLLVGPSAVPARAELQLQPIMTAVCRPAAPRWYTLGKWSQMCAHGDCFAWRLRCTDGASFTMHSAMHPGTTALEARFHAWAPWVYAVYMLPLVLYAALAIIGAGSPPAVALLNMIFLGYFFAAAVALDSSISGNPWSPWAPLRDLLLNGYGYIGALAAFVLVSAAAAWRGIEFLFFPLRADAAAGGALLFVDGGRARNASQLLMPSIDEFVDPAHMAAHYRRQTAYLNAQREQFEAQCALAETYLRLQRTLNEVENRSKGE